MIRTSRWKLRFSLTLVAVVPALVASSFIAPVASASAVSAGDFQAGAIISDALFYDSNAMTEAEIQTFLESKVSSCTNSNCLYSFKQSTFSRPKDRSVCNSYVGGENEPASRIIFKVQQACGISAKVLLVTLQKEQGLVTKTNPSDVALGRAMGYACPDNNGGVCDSTYYGFFNQVYWAAWQFKRYSTPDIFGGFWAGQTRLIQYSPNASCGSKLVLIENAATAALYNYTPYTPTDAALLAYPGPATGNDATCGSYGNRNFWYLFNDWFGSTGGEPLIPTSSERPYLLALDNSAQLWAYPANTTGGWMTRVKVGSDFQGIKILVGVDDFNFDGFRDLVGVDTSGAAWLFSGGGGLGYSTRSRLSVDWKSEKKIVAAGDFDGDGKTDVFTVDRNNNLTLWPGDGTGGFNSPKIVATGWNDKALIVSPGDFDGDGCSDVIASSSNGDLNLYKGDCAGGIKSTVRIGIGWSVIKALYALGDFNGDGISDLIAKDSAGDLWLYPGIGNGMITGSGRIGVGWANFTAITGPGPAPVSNSDGSDPGGDGSDPGGDGSTGDARQRPGAGDIDGDGNRDLVGVSSSGGVYLYPGNGDGGLLNTTKSMGATIVASRQLILLSDFDGDDISDLVRISSTGALEIYSGDGSGGFKSPRTIGIGWSGFNLVFGGIDFDGDGAEDLVGRDPEGRLWLYRGDGNGGWANGNGQLIGIGWGSFTSIFSVGNFDGKGGEDVIARARDGSLYLYPTEGGRFVSSKQIGVGWGVFVRVFSPGDFDGDGNPDVVALTTNGQLYLYRGDGSGGWLGSSQIGSGWQNTSWLG